MADKAISELVAAPSVTPDSLFVLQQDGTAKKLTAQVLENWLVSFADGHGGIQSIVKKSTSGLVDTYCITLADTTTFDFVVTNGRGVSSLKKTGTSGLVDTYTFTYNDGTTDTFTVTNGEKGDKGDRADIWVKYASQKPTASSHSFGDVPDSWIGLATGHNMDTAPTDWQQYQWYQWKGEKGDPGEPATLVSSQITYQVGNSGTIIPSGSWSESIPPVSQGKYLWTREITQFNTGNPITKYSVSRFGIDGSGSVSTVAGVSPDADGNVPLTAKDVKALPVAGGTMEGPVNMDGQSLSGLNAPTKDDEAATKGSSESYTDGQILDRVIYSGGKNLLKNTAVSTTKNGVTFTVNEDGSVTMNGTATTNIYFVLARLDYAMYKGRILSGCVDGNPTKYRLIATIFDSSGGWLGESTDYGEGVTIKDVASGSFIDIQIFINSGTVLNNTVFHPMIRLASETDDTYEPYYEGLMKLTDRGMELLWENASYLSDFAARTIYVDLSGYKEVLVLGRNAVSTQVVVGMSGYLQRINADTSKYYEFATKPFDVSNTGITFKDTFQIYWGGSNGFAVSVTNGLLQPVKIYGIKGAF